MAAVRFFLSYLAFALLWPWLRRNPKLRHGAAQRRGRGLPSSSRTRTRSEGPRVWCHGASAGDVLALLPTLQAVAEQRPHTTLTVSALTESGHTVAQRRAGPLAQVMYAPWDLPHCVAHALDALRPDVLVLEYAELWPNLIFAAQARKVALVLHNGRLSPSAMGRYRLLCALAGNVFAPFSALLMRDADEAARAVGLGARAARVFVTGDTKFDHVAQPPPATDVARLASTLALPPGVPLWVAGSTHEGEEAHLFAAQQALRTALPVAPLLLVAPRYMGRTAQLRAQAERAGLRTFARTCLAQAAPGAPRPQAGDVIFLDSVGELFAAYALADVVFVGGSFVARGGQNVLEPAALGKPVLFGPCMHNFAEAARLLCNGGGRQLQRPQELTEALRTLWQDEALRHRMGACAQAQVGARTGAAARNAAHILAAADSREWDRGGSGVSGASA